MTREERAREAYAQAVERLGGPARMSIAADIRADTSSDYYHVTMAAMLAFADAEAAAMRERAAGHMRKRAEELRDQCDNASTGAMFHAIFTAEADAIAALPATGEVGRG